MSSIDLAALRKAFGSTEVLRGVDLHIPSGKFVVILGPSGCGKSTLLRLVAGLETKTSGSIEIDGIDVSNLEPKDRGCAMVFQNYALYPHMTVAENIAYALRVEGRPRSERRRRAEEIARLVQLDGLLDRKPAELSGGQRQRVAMARAIIRSPRVFLFDEPLSNLDAELRAQMRHEVRRIHEEAGATSVFVTHDQVEAMTLADLLVVMRGGEIQQVGTPEEIYDRPATVYVARFIGSPGMGTMSAVHLSDKAALRLSDGQRVTLSQPFPGRPDSGIVAGIRPEAVRFDGPGSPIQAHLLFSEELGSARLHHLSIAGERVHMITPDKRTLEKGASVDLRIDAADLHLFDPETGRRVH